MTRLEKTAMISGTGAVIALAMAVWGAWLPHDVAGLVILGIDLPEFVKFMPEVQSGVISVQRETFFLPLVSLVGTMLLLGTWRRLSLWLRGLLVVRAVPVILAMLPPAWTPWLLKQPEFSNQMRSMAALALALLLSPLWLRLPERLRALLWVVVGLLPWAALRAYVALLPALSELYHQPLTYGAGFYATLAGALLALGTGVLLGAGAGNRA